MTMPRNASILLGAGWSLILIGLGLALYDFLAYDTTVQAQGLASIVSEMVQGNRVHNQGLMNNRLVGVVLGTGLALLGGMLLVLQGLSESASSQHRMVVLLTVLANKQGANQQDLENALGR
jgi:uncharacterized membrane protein